MKTLLPAILLIICINGFSQTLKTSMVFAPSEGFVKASEKPYREEICLNGLWEFQPVKLSKTFREGFDPVPVLTPAVANDWEKTPIRVPSPWNVNSFADRNGLGGDFRCYPSYPKAWESVKMAWMRKKVTVPSHWQGRMMMLHFDAVAGDVEVVVNGKKIGHHFEIFLPFDMDVTSAIIPGKENEILVGVRKSSLFDKQGDYGRRDYQAGSFWGQHIAGIWQDVYLIGVSDVRVSDVFVKPMPEAEKLEAEITLENDQNQEVEVAFDGAVYPWILKNGKDMFSAPLVDYKLGAKVLQMPEKSVKIPAHGKIKVSLTAEAKNRLKLWSPDAPNLYGLIVQTKTGGKFTDKKLVRFGWRQFDLKGNQFYLNGKPFILKGDSWHFLGIPQMTRRYAWAWFKAMRDANLNAVRLHAQPYPAFYLDMADEMGILVLDETAMWASDGGPKLNSSKYWRDSEEHLKGLVLRDRNHPSVFGWSVSNEIMPIVRGVMHNPVGMKDTLVKQYGVWKEICSAADPTRQWISADGEEDGEGKLPVCIVHYGGTNTMERAEKNGKPWGVGEAGNAYYGTPEQVSEANGSRAYESFQGRMEGVAASSYQSLMAQQEHQAIYRSVFNMVWYGLKPLPLGLKDTTLSPTLQDGVFFTKYQEGIPGVQPERIGPYCTTLNPGYDPSLPLYQTWPLFDAIHDASAEPSINCKWASVKQRTQTQSLPEKVKSVMVLGGNGSTLESELKRTGVSFSKVNPDEIPEILFIDGKHLPASDALHIAEKVFAKGGTVMIWSVAADQLPVLNSILPESLELNSRSVSSLLPVSDNILIQGLTPADLYFSELKPSEIITEGLAGPLVKQSEILIKACDTDWLRWNKQPEYAKTGMVLRSEREIKQSGVALIVKKVSSGRLLVTTLPAAPRLSKAEKMVRTILTNMGIELGQGNDAGKPLLKGGDIVRVLMSESFPVESLEDGAKRDFILPSNESIRLNASTEGKKWSLAYNENSLFDFKKIPLVGSTNNAVAYLSFWISSPRDLSDLLIEPNIPVVNMEVAADDAVQVWLNGTRIISNIRIGDINGGKAISEPLKIRQGWNHFLIKVIQVGGEWQFTGRLTCNQPDFLAELESALEKP